MRNHRKINKHFRSLILLILILTLGLGYAVLTQRLSIGANISYPAIKKDIGFSSATDNSGGFPSYSTISENKKTLEIICMVDDASLSNTCDVYATVENYSGFDVQLDNNPIVTFDSEYVNSVNIIWQDTNKNVGVHDVIEKGTTRGMFIQIATNSINDITDLNVNVTIQINWNAKDIVSVNRIILSNSDFINGCYYNNGTLKTGDPFSKLKTTEEYIYPQKIKVLIEDPINGVNTQSYKLVYSAYDEDGNILNPNDTSNAMFNINGGILILDLPTLYPTGAKFRVDIMSFNGEFYDIPSTALITVTTAIEENVDFILPKNSDFINGSYYATGKLQTSSPYNKLKTTEKYIAPQNIRITIEDTENDITTQNYKIVYSAYDNTGKILNPNDLTNAMYNMTSTTLDLNLPVLYPGATRFRIDVMRYDGSFYDIPQTATINITAID